MRLRQTCNHAKLVGFDLEKDKDALSADTAPQKTSDADIDSLADALGAVAIRTKQCDVCMSELSKESVDAGQAVCSECAADRENFNGESPERKRPKKLKTKKKVVKEQVKIEKTKRKQRNRRAVTDSDDEEADGSWLVPEDQQGPVRLGKAGGEEDEGEGDSINSEDSVHHSEDEDENGSRLDDFVVDDEGPEGNYGDDSDDSLVSVSKMGSKLIKGKRQAALQSATSNEGTDYTDSDSDAEDSADSDGVSESDVEEDDMDRLIYGPRKSKRGGHVAASAKIRELLRILHKETPEHKVIVFSQFTTMLDLMEPFLQRAGIKFTRYDGSMKNDDREASLKRLREDTATRVLLCSLKCGSLGLNLTAATRVVILEPFWNPFVEEQAIDRVHRLTQTVDVTVYKLTVADTIEQRILELQERKRQLAEETIEGGMRKKKGGVKLGLNELLQLFSHSTDDGPDKRFADSGGVRRDMGAMMGGIAALPRDAPVFQPDPAFSRRW